jgi:hypothetical protein
MEISSTPQSTPFYLLPDPFEYLSVLHKVLLPPHPLLHHCT